MRRAALVLDEHPDAFVCSEPRVELDLAAAGGGLLRRMFSHFDDLVVRAVQLKRLPQFRARAADDG